MTMQQRKRPEPAILRTRLVRGSDGRLRVEPHTSTTQRDSTRKWSTFKTSWTRQLRNATTTQLNNIRKFRISKRAPNLRGKLAVRWLFHRKVYAAIAVGCLALVIISSVLLHRPAATREQSHEPGGAVQGAQTASGPVPGHPSYATLVPSGKSIQSLGGWYRVSPPNSDPVYAFADSVGSVHLDVSEQPLPESFKSDTADHVSQLAQSFGANEKLTAKGLTIYIGTSAKGPQSVILTENNLLILIRSTDKLTNDQWLAYVSALS